MKRKGTPGKSGLVGVLFLAAFFLAFLPASAEQAAVRVRPSSCALMSKQPVAQFPDWNAGWQECAAYQGMGWQASLRSQDGLQLLLTAAPGEAVSLEAGFTLDVPCAAVASAQLCAVFSSEGMDQCAVHSSHEDAQDLLPETWDLVFSGCANRSVEACTNSAFLDTCGELLLFSARLSALAQDASQANATLAVDSIWADIAYEPPPVPEDGNQSDNTSAPWQKGQGPVFPLSSGIDPMVNASDIVFSTESPVEGVNVTINATIYNEGDQPVTGAVVQFFDGNYSSGVQIGSNLTVSIPAGGSFKVNASWNASIGTHSIFVLVDPPIDSNGVIAEPDEGNNVGYRNITVESWTYLVGNITGSISLRDSTNRTALRWNVSNLTGGNVLVADIDSSIQFLSLRPLGLNTSNATRYQDFAAADAILRIENNSDSLNRSFLSNSLPVALRNFTVLGRRLENVSVANSTNSTNFLTGILWDSSDDTNGYFDSVQQEDLVFIANINQGKPGRFGVQDYEIRVPGNLRNYKSGNFGSVKMYVEVR